MKKISILLVFTFIVSFANAQCSDLFFSEYVEGSQYNKAIEIYNPTSAAVDLSKYVVKRYNNGGTTPSNGVVLSGTLQPYETHVLVNGLTDGTVDADLIAKADQRCPGNYDTDNTVFWNGNDAVTLEKLTGQIVDVFGKVGEDPGEGWYNVAPYTTNNYWEAWSSDHILIRKSTVKKGITENPSEFDVSLEWDSLPKDTWTNLGMHQCDCNTGTYVENNQHTSQLFFFPNPASPDNELLIKSTGIIKKVEIINSIGQLIYLQNNNSYRGDMKVQLRNAQRGIYVVRAWLENNEQVTQKLIIK